MKKMLIIEDDQIVGSIYLRKFQVEGFQVELALDGEAGLASTLKSRPDIVILDLMLPRLNGVEVLKKLRAEPTTRDLPVEDHRSEEHTSELQSQFHLVCRLLLEKISSLSMSA